MLSLLERTARSHGAWWPRLDSATTQNGVRVFRGKSSNVENEAGRAAREG